MAEPQTLAAGHPTETWAALIGSITIIGGLVTVLWKRLNDDVKAQEQKLETGAQTFIDIGKRLVQIGEQIEALEREDEFEGGELDRLELDIKDLQKRLLIIETEHKGCQERLNKLGGK